MVAPEGAKVRIEAAASLTPSPTVQASSFSLADIKVRLVPEAEFRTSKEPSWLKLRISTASIYHVVWIGVGIVQLLIWLQPHIQDIREEVSGFTVSFERLVERVTKTPKEAQPQPTPKNEHPEKSTDPSAISSEGD